MDAESLRSTMHSFGQRLGMWTLGSTFAEACALIQGFDAASNEGLLDGFRDWLLEREGARPELAWPGLVVAVALPGERVVYTAFTPEQDRVATAALFALLDEFLSLG
jgi:hypothetical protein